MTGPAPARIARADVPDPPRRWQWERERLRARLAPRADAIRDAVLAPLLSELDPPAADALRRDRDGWPALVERLLDDLDLATALHLLLPDRPLARPLPIPEPTWQEAALDAASLDAASLNAISPAGAPRDTDRTDTAPPGPVPPGAATILGPSASALDRNCAFGCAVLAAAALDRIPIPDPLRDRLRSLLPGTRMPPKTEAAVLEAILFGRPDALVSILSRAAGLSAAAVRNALATANRRGLVAMAWKAGYGMRVAWSLQVLAAGIEPHRALDADPDGGCPLGRAEMAWQLGFMERAASG